MLVWTLIYNESLPRYPAFLMTIRCEGLFTWWVPRRRCLPWKEIRLLLDVIKLIFLEILAIYRNYLPNELSKSHIQNTANLRFVHFHLVSLPPFSHDRGAQRSPKRVRPPTYLRSNSWFSGFQSLDSHKLVHGPPTEWHVFRGESSTRWKRSDDSELSDTLSGGMVPSSRKQVLKS